MDRSLGQSSKQRARDPIARVAPCRTRSSPARWDARAGGDRVDHGPPNPGQRLLRRSLDPLMLRRPPYTTQHLGARKKLTVFGRMPQVTRPAEEPGVLFPQVVHRLAHSGMHTARYCALALGSTDRGTIVPCLVGDPPTMEPDRRTGPLAGLRAVRPGPPTCPHGGLGERRKCVRGGRGRSPWEIV